MFRFGVIGYRGSWGSWWILPILQGEDRGRRHVWIFLDYFMHKYLIIQTLSVYLHISILCTIIAVIFALQNHFYEILYLFANTNRHSNLALPVQSGPLVVWILGDLYQNDHAMWNCWQIRTFIKFHLLKSP